MELSETEYAEIQKRLLKKRKEEAAKSTAELQRLADEKLVAKLKDQQRSANARLRAAETMQRSYEEEVMTCEREIERYRRGLESARNSIAQNKPVIESLRADLKKLDELLGGLE